VDGCGLDGFQLGQLADQKLNLAEGVSVGHLDQALRRIDVEDAPLRAIEHGLHIWAIQRSHMAFFVDDQHGLNPIFPYFLNHDLPQFVI